MSFKRTYLNLRVWRAVTSDTPYVFFFFFMTPSRSYKIAHWLHSYHFKVFLLWLEYRHCNSETHLALPATISLVFSKELTCNFYIKYIYVFISSNSNHMGNVWCQVMREKIWKLKKRHLPKILKTWVWSLGLQSGRRDPIPTSCPLTSTHVFWDTHTLQMLG